MTPQGMTMTPQSMTMTPQGMAMTPQGMAMTPQGMAMTPQGIAMAHSFPYAATYGWGGHAYPPPLGPLITQHTPPTPAVAPAPLATQMLPSSDPPDITAVNRYPTISDFIAALQPQHPHRNLRGLTATFALHDYFFIDEIMSFTKSELMGDGFHLSGGNAKFLLQQVDDEMRRVEHTGGFKRKRMLAVVG
jgi:hypothetical protein